LVGAATLNSGRQQRPIPADADLAYFPSGHLLHATAVGFKGLAADVAFLRAVQYYGEHRKSDRQYPWTRHLFHVVTELDPWFVTPYLFGALVLADDMSRLDLSVDLLERGMAANPKRWELPVEAGFLSFVHQRDATAAAIWFRQAMTMPGAPEYVRRFAAFTLTRSGSHAQALKLWREIEQNATEPAIREAARRYIDELEQEGGRTANG